MLGNKNIKLEALGAGSDWSGFIQHLGISSMNLSFSGEGPGGEYHSIYDSYDHFIRFKDPGFHYGVALVQTTGRVMMRMANADILPVDYKSFGNTVAEYADDIKNLLNNTRTATESENKMIADRLFYLANDPEQKLQLPAPKESVPYLNFSQLENSIAALKESADEFQRLYSSAIKLSGDKQRSLNEVLYKTERSLVLEKGLPGRPWYKHQVYAPGLYTGYGVKTLPAVREAIEQRNWKAAQVNIDVLAQTLNDYNDQVNKAVSIMKN
jgi:N-acetylated-alpha-linked acidic dipeptidase